jgi:ribosome-associated heat shock protein Hsp15
VTGKGAAVEPEGGPAVAGAGPQPGGLAEARVDKWLWAVRLYKTRTAATDACRAGHVRLNRAGAKPSATLRPGDVVEARAGDREAVLQVTAVIDKRVSAPIAATCYVDLTPAPPAAGYEARGPVRDRGSGRPTKKDRRQLERAQGH